MAAISITAGQVLMGTGATSRAGTAGEAITAGMPVYRAANTRYMKAIANAANTSSVAGISLNGASGGQPIDICTSGALGIGGTVAVGESYYLSDATAGQIIPVGDLGSGDFPVFLGIANTSSNININIIEGGVAKA